MLTERERNRLERLGVIQPEPVDSPVEPYRETMEPQPDPSAIDLARVPTTHTMDYRPLCQRCRRPYSPDAPLQRAMVAAGLGGCYQCAKLNWLATSKTLKALGEIS